MNLNIVIVAGRLTRDPELKALPSGSNVCNMSLATNRTYQDVNGTRQEAAEFHEIVVFGKQAEATAKYLSKGNFALVEGRLQTRSWEKDGQKHYRTEIVADRVQFGPKGSDNGAQARSGNEPTPADAPNYPEEEITPEDIPF